MVFAVEALAAAGMQGTHIVVGLEFQFRINAGDGLHPDVGAEVGNALDIREQVEEAGAGVNVAFEGAQGRRVGFIE